MQQAPGLVGTLASPASATAAGGNVTALLDILADDLTFTQDRKADTEAALMEDLLLSLHKEKQKLEEDAWRYAAPRSQPKLIS